MNFCLLLCKYILFTSTDLVLMLCIYWLLEVSFLNTLWKSQATNIRVYPADRFLTRIKCIMICNVERLCTVNVNSYYLNFSLGNARKFAPELQGVILDPFPPSSRHLKCPRLNVPRHHALFSPSSSSSSRGLKVRVFGGVSISKIGIYQYFC